MGLSGAGANGSCTGVGPVTPAGGNHITVQAFALCS
jgi:hypothetical protein